MKSKCDVSSNIEMTLAMFITPTLTRLEKISILADSVIWTHLVCNIVRIYLAVVFLKVEMLSIKTIIAKIMMKEGRINN